MVNNIQDKIEISEAFVSQLEEVGNFLLRHEGLPLECEVSIMLVDNSYIHELNFTYRGLDSSTDVLAFNLQDDLTVESKDKILGDVVVSVEKANKQAKACGNTLKQEIALLTIHGMLHLLGYEHGTDETEREMNEKQELILKKFNFLS